MYVWVPAYMCTCVWWRQRSEECQILGTALETVVSHHVGAEIQNWVLSKSSQGCSEIPCARGQPQMLVLRRSQSRAWQSLLRLYIHDHDFSVSAVTSDEWVGSCDPCRISNHPSLSVDYARVTLAQSSPPPERAEEKSTPHTSHLPTCHSLRFPLKS